MLSKLRDWVAANKGKTVLSILTFVSLVAGVIIELDEVKAMFFGNTGNLKVVAIDVKFDRSELAFTIDFKVLNNGKGSVIINSVVLKAEEVRRQPYNGVIESRLETSGEYNLDVSRIFQFGDMAKCEVSQEVKPNSADRFSVVVTGKEMDEDVRAFRFRVVLQTSEGNIDCGIIHDNQLILLPYNQFNVPATDSAILRTIYLLRSRSR